MKRNFLVIAAVILLCCLWAGWLFYFSAHGLSCSYYEVPSAQLDSPLRIVQLSDLHNSEFGRDNEKLVKLVEDQSPDLILITGDLLNSTDENTAVAVNLIQKLCPIAPVYLSMGNHEEEYQERFGIDLTALFEEAGASVLDFQYEDVSVNGQALRIGGIYGYCLPAKYLRTGEADEAQCAFLAEFQDTSAYTVLMCHMPACWIVNDGISQWEVDCVFAGHAHGGQVRLPFVGGLWAPDQGWFPGRECGLYPSADGSKVLVLSRGLGSTAALPRFNNVPEVVVVDLIPGK